MAAAMPQVRNSEASLDLPGILPLLLVAATWEFLLIRVVGLAAGSAPRGELETLVHLLSKVGQFAENFSLLLALVLLGHAVLELMRQPAFGPVAHRLTISGFASLVLVIGAAGSFLVVQSETALLAHGAVILMALLLVFGLWWHKIPWRLVVLCVLFLLPALLRFYSSCALSIHGLRTDTAVPLMVFRAAEAIALGATMASPWLVLGFTIRHVSHRASWLNVGLASLPALAFAAVLVAHGPEIRELCLLSLGLELVVQPPQVFYPLGLFCLFFTLSMVILPGMSNPRTDSEQRVAYGLALLFLAGLDGLRGTVASLGVEGADVPELIRFLLEGHWEHLHPAHQAVIGPPVRDLYQVVLMGLGYLLLVRGVYGQRTRSQQPADDSDEQELSP
jgi:hypothetical protein